MVDVLQLISDTTRRGAQLFALSLAPELESRGMSVRTVALAPGSPDALDVDRLGASALAPPTLRALRRAMGDAEVVIAHGSTTLPASVLASLGRRSRPPIVYRNIGDPYHWGSTARRRWQNRLLLARVDRVVALTDETARRMTERYAIAPKRIDTIPHGVSPAGFPLATDSDRCRARRGLGVEGGGPLAVFVGALSEEKDPESAVAAIAACPDWTLLLAGDGPLRSAVERRAADVGDARVRLLGQVDDTAGLFAAADLLVLSSRTEGLPGVVIEAAMVGVPAVVTDVGFVGDIVSDGVNGSIVPPGDPAALARAIEGADLDVDRSAIRSAVDRFSLDRVADRWAEVVTDLGAGRRPSTL